MKKINKTFRIGVFYEETKYNHDITERWICHSLKDVKKILNIALDIQTVDKYGRDIPRLTLDDVRRNLSGFADEKSIRREYRRLKKNFQIYDELIECAETFDPGDHTLRHMDSKTTVHLLYEK